MFKKLDQFIDHLLDKKWIRVSLVLFLIINAIVAIFGWIMLYILSQ